MKFDVFSLGVLMLEIVSGMKNRNFFHVDDHHNLLGHALSLSLCVCVPPFGKLYEHL